MERFEANMTMAVALGLSGVAVLGLVGFAIVSAVPQFAQFTVVIAAAGVFMAGGFVALGGLLLHSAREAAVRFVVDDEGITRIAWGRTTRLAWREVVRLEEQSTTGPKAKAGASGRCVLHGVDGRRLSILFPFAADGARLRGRLELYLAPLRRQDLRNLARHGRRFRPHRTAGLLTLTGIAPLFLICGLMTFDPDSNRQPPKLEDWKPFGVFCLAVGSALVVLGAELISRELEVTTDGLALRSLFLHRAIPFAGVASIDVKTIDPEDGTITERAKIRGEDGLTITIDSSMPGYRAVLNLVRLRAAAKPDGSLVGDPEFA